MSIKALQDYTFVSKYARHLPDKKRRETWLKTILARSGSFAEKFPEVAKEWDYKKNCDLKPQQVTPHSEKKVWWKCLKGEGYE